MNWYKKIKISAPVPEAEDYPIPYGNVDYRQKGDYFTKYNVDTIMDIDQMLKDTSMFKKYGPLKYIGSGTNGIAYYSTSDGKVVKITRDIGEYRAAKKVVILQNKSGKQLPIVRIFGAEEIDSSKIKKNIYTHESELYIIVMERVQTIEDSKEQEILKKLSDFITNNPYYYDDLTLKIKKKMIFELINKHASLNWDEFSNIADNFFTMTNSLVIDAKMTLQDIHINNIGKRTDGSYVLLDLGHSFSKIHQSKHTN